jgi:hypothetical protein
MDLFSTYTRDLNVGGLANKVLALLSATNSLIMFLTSVP